jgi:hypothetical protein
MLRGAAIVETKVFVPSIRRKRSEPAEVFEQDPRGGHKLLFFNRRKKIISNNIYCLFRRYKFRPHEKPQLGRQARSPVSARRDQRQHRASPAASVTRPFAVGKRSAPVTVASPAGSVPVAKAHAAVAVAATSAKILAAPAERVVAGV